ncbi:MAG: tRNA (guanosine(46)-N7)-methyltransferase TrmB [Thiolinea sp.]
MSDKKSNRTSTPGTKPRPIKSFVLRQGRKTKAQQYALDNYWAEFGIEESDELLNFPAIFGNDAPVTLEIGFGNGESLATMAQAAPERNFVGIEVHSPGVGHLLHLVNEYGLKNVRVMDSDASEILKKRIPDSSLDRLQLFFPDPWHKKRHNKRRIVQPTFASLVARLLKKDGVFHMATDWEDYALHMAEVMQASTEFANCHSGDSPYSPRPEYRPLTKFEQRGLKLGHGVWDLLYYKR